jgi:cyclophilin family peptidyl-prolyl cis-trans isomerase
MSVSAHPAGSGIPWPADYPIDGDHVAVLTITQVGVGPLGEIVLEFFPDRAPNHVRNFDYLARSGFYDGTKFHRVIEGFMIQGGDPNTKSADPSTYGMGGPGWSINQEFNSTPHKKGTLSMARSNDPNSAGSQFFICHDTASHLDRQYTAFGNVIRGIEIVDSIAATPVGGPQNSSPIHPIEITSVRIEPRS